MAIFSQEQVQKVLNAYNPWWNLGKIPNNYVEDIKRIGYYEAKKVLDSKDIKRFVILSGARRVGKTTIIYQLINDLLEKGVNEKNILYVSLDNPILKFGTLDKIMETYIENISPKGEIYVFFDEIQYSKDWNSWLKVFYDQKKDWKIVATGSASPLIDKGATESGVGRWITITIPTLSFYEYCMLVYKTDELELDEFINKLLELPNEEKKNISVKDSVLQIKEYIEKNMSIVSRIKQKIPKDFSITKMEKMKTEELGNLINILEPIKESFNRYLIIGGFPELVLSEDDRNAQKILREDIVDKVLKRDLPELFNVRNISVLEKVFLYLCFESSNIINFTSMGQDLEGVSIPTLQDYIKYLESANLIYISEPINLLGTKLLKNKPKIYVVDSAIRNAVLMKDDSLTNPTEMGYIVETAVYRHMQTYMKNVTGNIGYYRDRENNKEIDIVTNSVKENMYIEVKYREKANIKNDNPIYTKAGKNDRLFIITKSSDDYGIVTLENKKKLVRIPAYVFLFLVGLEEMNKIDKE